MEPFTWLIVLGVWLLLLLLGLAGGDPLALGRPGHEAPLVKLALALSRHARGRRERGREARHYPAPLRPSESGLHAVA